MCIQVNRCKSKAEKENEQSEFSTKIKSWVKRERMLLLLRLFFGPLQKEEDENPELSTRSKSRWPCFSWSAYDLLTFTAITLVSLLSLRTNESRETGAYLHRCCCMLVEQTRLQPVCRLDTERRRSRPLNCDFFFLWKWWLCPVSTRHGSGLNPGHEGGLGSLMIWATYYVRRDWGSKRGGGGGGGLLLFFVFVLVEKNKITRVRNHEPKHSCNCFYLFISSSSDHVDDFVTLASHRQINNKHCKTLILIITILKSSTLQHLISYFFFADTDFCCWKWSLLWHQDTVRGGREKKPKSTRWQWETKNDSCKSGAQMGHSRNSRLHETNYTPTH